MANLPAINEAWRTQAYCQVHRKSERIVRIRNQTSMQSGNSLRFNALVEIECGERLQIITTARNLAQMATGAT